MQVQKRDDSNTKEFVAVIAAHWPDGRVEPLRIQRDDGTVIIISKVLESRKAASLRAGGAGMRHTCRAANAEDGHEFKMYLFHDNNFWFIEVTERGGDILFVEGTS
jgi:hypothetical protein